MKRKSNPVVVLKVVIHRGLTWEDMPGKDPMIKRLTFATFRRAQWPPPNWKVPSHLEGPDLKILIEERLAMNRRKLGRG